MVTRKFMGRNQLVNRLAVQVGGKKKAMDILKNRGEMKEDGKLTSKGEKRNAMTAAERAKDRASKYSKHSAKDYKYNVSTNRAVLKKK